MFKKIIVSFLLVSFLLVSFLLLASCATTGNPNQQNSTASKEDISSTASAAESNVSDEFSEEISNEISDEVSEDDTTENLVQVPKAYLGIINRLQTIVEERLSLTFESKWMDTNYKGFDLPDTASDNQEGDFIFDVEYHWSNMIIDLDWDRSGRTVEQYGYAIADLNKDEIPELLFMSDDGFVFAIFTLCDNEPVLLEAFWPRSRCAILENGDIFTRGSNGAEYSEFEVRNVDKDTCELKTKIFYDYNTHDGIYTIETDGKNETVDKETIDELLSEYPEDFEAANRAYLKANNIKFVNFIFDKKDSSPLLFFDETEGNGKAVVIYAFDESGVYTTNQFKYNGKVIGDFADETSIKVESSIIGKDKNLEFFAPDGKSFKTAVGETYCVGESTLGTAHVKTELKDVEGASKRYIGTYDGIGLIPEDIEISDNSITADLDGDGKKDRINWEFTPAKEHGEEYYFYSIEIQIGEKTLNIKSEYLPVAKEDLEIFVTDVGNDGFYDLLVYEKAVERFESIAFYNLSLEHELPVFVYEIVPQN